MALAQQQPALTLPRPAYDNAYRDFPRWYERNEAKLRRFWSQLSQGGRLPEGGEWEIFCAAQFELATL